MPLTTLSWFVKSFRSTNTHTYHTLRTLSSIRLISNGYTVCLVASRMRWDALVEVGHVCSCINVKIWSLNLLPFLKPPCTSATNFLSSTTRASLPFTIIYTHCLVGHSHQTYATEIISDTRALTSLLWHWCYEVNILTATFPCYMSLLCAFAG